MKYLKKAGVYVTTLDNVTFGSDLPNLSAAIKSGKRNDFIKFNCTTKDGACAVKIFLPKKGEDQSKYDFKFKNLQKFFFSFDKKIEDFDLKEVKELANEILGKDFKALFQEVEYLNRTDDGKIYLNVYMQYKWGSKVDYDLPFNREYALKKLSDIDQAEYDKYLATKNQNTEENYNNEVDEDDDLPF